MSLDARIGHFKLKLNDDLRQAVVDQTGIQPDIRDFFTYDPASGRYTLNAHIGGSVSVGVTKNHQLPNLGDSRLSDSIVEAYRSATAHITRPPSEVVGYGHGV